MKHKPTPLSNGKNMMITEMFKCNICRKKIEHWARGSHLTTHHPELYPEYFKPIRNKN